MASTRARCRAIRSSAAASAPVAWATVRTSTIVSPNVRGSSAMTCGQTGSLLRDRLDLVVADRADRAQLLRDDQVGLELAQQLLVEAVDRVAALGALADGRVDPRRVEAGRQLVAREVRQLERAGRIVALVRDADHVVAEAEREQQLGGVGHEAHDAHRRIVDSAA